MPAYGILVTGLLSVVALAAPETCEGAQHEQNGLVPKGETVQPEQMAGIREFSDRCLKNDRIANARVRGMGKIAEGMPHPLLETTVEDRFGAKIAYVDIDPCAGTVYMYISANRDEPAAKGHSIDDAITADAAWQAAQPVLAYYGLSYAREEFRFQMGDSEPEGNDLYGAYWYIEYDYTYNGLPCRYNTFRVKLSAYSGTILTVHNAPIIVPKEPQQKISKTKAIEQAKAWLEERLYLKGKQPTVDETAPDRIEEVIARPNRSYVVDGEAPEMKLTEEAFYCWEVPFEFIEDGNTFRRSVWVNIETGQVIGCWRYDK